MSEIANVGWARDADIRESLRARLRAEHANEPNTLLVEEMGLCQGDARIDLGVINGTFNGYEIKSPRDTLERLPRQIDVYSRTLDFVTVITSMSHVDSVLEMVPVWWGVAHVALENAELAIQYVREQRRNPQLDPRAIVQFLWRDEVLAVLTDLGLDRGVRSKPKQVLWERLTSSVNLPQLHEIVRDSLKSRQGWSTGQPLA